MARAPRHAPERQCRPARLWVLVRAPRRSRGPVAWVRPFTFLIAAQRTESRDAPSRRFFQAKDGFCRCPAGELEASHPAFYLAGGRGNAYSGLYSVTGVLAIAIRVWAALRSCCRKSANPCGVVGAPTTACFSKKSTNLGSANRRANSALRRATMSGGVPFGAARPHQP